ncbi:MAG: hypothetical protein AVDCRST_MAG62-891 [uncultured Sphingomonas sp.]|uniref:Periplasmic membrane protein n=1 Tax=uncultured Sphingomonas sp. TaxID=158754 RepID=A0A6J4T9T2_9SPHN|nr:MAG: hypothetical protein AVDCRST_MAG62-891 [uncultured Sphingomonas sp.]
MAPGVNSTPEQRAGLPIMHFADQAELERWLGEQPADHPGIWLKLAKKGAGVASINLAEAVDSGLCFGWIDGLLNRYDERFYLIRYMPRRPRSKWSQVNAERAEQLLAEGRVRPVGLKQIEAAQADGRWDMAYPPASRIEVPDDLAAALAANPAAATFFASLTRANRYAILYRLHDVRDPAKREGAIAKWVAMLERGETVHD